MKSFSLSWHSWKGAGTMLNKGHVWWGEGVKTKARLNDSQLKQP